MTKEEAKNSLVNTKVYVAGKSAEIQKKLFELGFTWKNGDTVIKNLNMPFLYLHDENIGNMGNIAFGDDMLAFSNHDHKEVTADYILGLTWEEKSKLQPFDKVLTRDSNNQNWKSRFYYDACDREGTMYFDQILPYEGNEHLAFTNNNPE